MEKLKDIRNMHLFDIFMLTIAGMINAFGITMFLTPVKLYDSSISGTSMLLSQITPEYLNLSFFLVVLNIPIFLFGLKKQGVKFTFYAIYTVCVYFIINRFQVVKMKDIVHAIDEHAYIIINDVADVFKSNQDDK